MRKLPKPKRRQRLPPLITRFVGQHAFLSNFYPCQVEFEGVMYPSSEHAFQAAKTRDKRERQAVRHALTAGEAKRLGRKVSLREDWDSVRVKVMREILVDKFTRNPDLGIRLVETRNSLLIEGNHWNDTFWGVCAGRGKNHLGKLLMQVRKTLREADERDHLPKDIRARE